MSSNYNMYCRPTILIVNQGNHRIIKKWCSNKWKVEEFNVEALVKEIKKAGMRVAANYMIGFPDETEEEIQETIEFAKRNMSYGLDASNFFLEDAQTKYLNAILDKIAKKIRTSNA